MNYTDPFNRTVMDYLNVGNMSCYELYTLHTGHSPYDSDNDSIGSIASSSYLDEYEPPLYTYEEIEANSVVVEPVGTQSKAIECDGAGEWLEIDSLSQQMITKELAELVLSDSCRLCNVTKCSKHDIEHHKMGKAHRKKVDQYIKDRLEILRSIILSQEAFRSTTQTISTTSSTPNRKLATNAVRSPGKLDKISLQEQLLKLMGKDYCNICNTVLPQAATALTHYHSPRHKNKCHSWLNAEVERLQLSKITIDASWSVIPKTAKKLRCSICKITVDTGLGDHFNSDLHKSYKEAFCFVCNIRTSNKQQLAEHVKGARHQGNLKKKSEDLLVPQTIVTPVTKQGKSSRSLMQTKSFDEKLDTYAQVVADSLQTAHTAKAKVVTFYCHICKLTFASKTDVDNHVNSFPHTNLSKLMSKIVSKGISSRNVFWDYTDLEITCNLCTAYIRSEASATGHLTSKRHLNKFSVWCSQQPEDRMDPNGRFFYCNVCEISLDGTTNAEVHYGGHATKQKETTKSFLDAASTSSTVILQPDTRMAVTDANKNYNKLSQTGSRNDAAEAKHLEEMLLSETVKFMYLLKSIPASRAVHYLQKCIKELENEKNVTLRT